MLCWRIACFNYCLSASLQFVHVCADPLQNYDVTLKPGLDHNSVSIEKNTHVLWHVITFPMMIPYEKYIFYRMSLHSMTRLQDQTVSHLCYVCLYNNQPDGSLYVFKLLERQWWDMQNHKTVFQLDIIKCPNAFCRKLNFCLVLCPKYLENCNSIIIAVTNKGCNEDICATVHQIGRLLMLPYGIDTGMQKINAQNVCLR